jgi:CRISPR-associated protein Csx14
MSEYTHTLIATLGGQPQVVTFTLDHLLEQGFPIREIYVGHPEASQPRLQRSLTLLSGEFAGDCYRFNGHTLHFRSQILLLDDDPLNDITNTASAYGTLNTIQHLICDLKRQRRHIHLSVTGGRRLMSLLALSVASLHFDHQDHIWHIYTPDALRERVISVSPSKPSTPTKQAYLPCVAMPGTKVRKRHLTTASCRKHSPTTSRMMSRAWPFGMKNTSETVQNMFRTAF